MTLLKDIDLGTPAPPPDAPPVSVEVDGITITVPEGSSVMRAAALAGIDIPKLCASDSLDAFGSCRLCLVEIDGRRGTPASCTTPVSDGMRIRTQSTKLEKLRQGVMEQARKEDWSFLDAILGKGQELGVYTVPGDGMVDYPAVFKALPGYSGWVVVEAEQDPEKAHPLTYAKKGVAHLKQSLKEAGLA